MNGRGLRGALRLIVSAAALGITLLAGVSSTRVVSTLSDDAGSPSVVVDGGGSAGASSVTSPVQAAPDEASWT
jgi:hypothetical protein